MLWRGAPENFGNFRCDLKKKDPADKKNTRFGEDLKKNNPALIFCQHLEKISKKMTPKR